MKKTVWLLLLGSLLGTSSVFAANTFHTVLTTNSLFATNAPGPKPGPTGTTYAVSAIETAEYKSNAFTVKSATSFLIQKFQEMSGTQYPVVPADAVKDTPYSSFVTFQAADKATGGYASYDSNGQGIGPWLGKTWKITAVAVPQNNGNNNIVITYTLTQVP